MSYLVQIVCKPDQVVVLKAWYTLLIFLSMKDVGKLIGKVG
jgi:predicted RNA-binding protein YlqC (UPF0109 family)